MIYHLAEVPAWDRALATGTYTQSTLGRTLIEEGFIHCSEESQWPATRERYYAAYPDELVLLTIDEDRLNHPLVREVGNPRTGERFPHLYGELDVAAVVATEVLSPPHAAR